VSLFLQLTSTDDRRQCGESAKRKTAKKRKITPGKRVSTTKRQKIKSKKKKHRKNDLHHVLREFLASLLASVHTVLPRNLFIKNLSRDLLYRSSVIYLQK